MLIYPRKRIIHEVVRSVFLKHVHRMYGQISNRFKSGYSISKMQKPTNFITRITAMQCRYLPPTHTHVSQDSLKS
ncbi:hypothetical protein J437_LFUL014829 [Ladona fulva]|uniref:Uncharacterized protein n=1 Tax=Ladona fulva TaxID=123851 RepID=A0A8K0KGE6_LADFU|nr:hypothetical protein J437_LFUL014829 [Ladona fulva]